MSVLHECILEPDKKPTLCDARLLRLVLSPSVEQWFLQALRAEAHRQLLRVLLPRNRALCFLLPIVRNRIRLMVVCTESLAQHGEDGQAETAKLPALVRHAVWPRLPL